VILIKARIALSLIQTSDHHSYPFLKSNYNLNLNSTWIPTFKLAGLWILNPQWLSDSLTAGKILDEIPYEVSRYHKVIVLTRIYVVIAVTINVREELKLEGE
jgi:hypothetical protein